jgi:nucleotide-binding universal stress UspA family protein
MFTSILVPLDGTRESEVALSPARTLASTLGAEIILLRVVPTDGKVSVLSTPELNEASDYLESLASRLHQTDVHIEVVVSHGGPADTIVAEAHTRGVDLIVMATHGPSGLERLVMGSVAERVLAGSRVPVMLVGPTDRRMKRLKLILVALDGSPGSLVALGTASRLARATRAAVVLLRVVVPLPLWIYDPSLGLNTGPLIDPRWDEDRRANAEAYVRQVAQKLLDSGIEAGADALLGDVAPTIAEYADQEAVDLIVMATHARVGPARALFGSVADQVVRTARLPVLLVRSEPWCGAESDAASIHDGVETCDAHTRFDGREKPPLRKKTSPASPPKPRLTAEASVSDVWRAQ